MEPEKSELIKAPNIFLLFSTRARARAHWLHIYSCGILTAGEGGKELTTTRCQRLLQRPGQKKLGIGPGTPL